MSNGPKIQNDKNIFFLHFLALKNWSVVSFLQTKHVHANDVGGGLDAFNEHFWKQLSNLNPENPNPISHSETGKYQLFFYTLSLKSYFDDSPSYTIIFYF